MMLLHSSADEQLGCSHFLALMSNVGILLLYKFLCGYIFGILLGYVPRNKSGGSNDNCTFNYLRNPPPDCFLSATPFCTPASSALGLQLLHILTNTGIA